MVLKTPSQGDRTPNRFLGRWLNSFTHGPLNIGNGTQVSGVLVSDIIAVLIQDSNLTILGVREVGTSLDTTSYLFVTNELMSIVTCSLRRVELPIYTTLTFNDWRKTRSYRSPHFEHSPRCCTYDFNYRLILIYFFAFLT